jgi:pimeloyl-ACP methyl ester carboxylesterase
MAERPVVVFVHGGQHTGACWQPTIDAMRAIDPSVPTLAVDLPGRRDQPGDLATLTIAQCVASVVRQIDASGSTDIVLVGHSMAGLTLPGVAATVGPDRIRRMIYLACCVPAQGKAIVDTLLPPIGWITKRVGRSTTTSGVLPGPIASWMFANGMTKAQKAAVVAGLVPESANLTREPVDRSAMPDLPTTWILTLRDHSLRPKLQRRCIGHLGNVDEVIEIDTCHNAMVSEPDLVARLVLDRVRGSASTR